MQKISKHITKKVADKLISLFKNDREKFEACWPDVANFVKFGCIKDEGFYDKVKDIIIYKDLNGKFLSFNELLGTEAFCCISSVPFHTPVHSPARYAAPKAQQSKIVYS